MISLDERTGRRSLGVILALTLAGCGSHQQLASAGAGATPANGPAADYPVVVGEPYKVGDRLYIPADTMNYDEVGHAAAIDSGGIVGANHVLPLPSYVEVTSLDTGHTILVRVEKRGPMDGDAVIALSSAAFTQLGAAVGAPVRVRRVNPPEEERAALRAGRSAPARMDTPASLVAVLKRKLPDEGSLALTAPKPSAPTALAAIAMPPSTAAPHPVGQPVVESAPVQASAQAAAQTAPTPLPTLKKAADKAAQVSAKAPVVAAKPEPKAAAPKPSAAIKVVVTDTKGAYGVQAATMSTLDRAKTVAGVLGGTVAPVGKYFRVRTGPFATREQAEASLAKVRAAGYSDARIYTNG